MRPILTEKSWRDVAAAVLVAGLGALAGGCATSTGATSAPERPVSAPLVLNSTATGETVAEVHPAVMVQEGSRPGDPMAVTAGVEPPPLPRQPAEAPVLAAAEPGAEPRKKLLTPEEKARVIAELEALARSQEARAPDAEAGCADDALMALEPEERLKRDSAGGEC